MRREKFYTALWAIFFGFFLSFSATAGLVSAFNMEVPTDILAWVCLGASLVSTVCYSLPLGLVPLGFFAITLGFYYKIGALELSAESLLYRLSRQYNRGYGWPIIRWNGRTAPQLEQTLPLLLCLIGILIACLICRGICRKKPVAWGIVPNLLCLAACFVVNDTPPDTVFLFLQLLCLIVLLLISGAGQRDLGQNNKLMAISVPVTALALLVLFACVPRQEYSNENASQLSRRFAEMKFVQTLLGNTAGDQMDNGDVDLTKVGYQVPGKTKTMDVEADYTGTLYLRNRALDHYDGVSWTKDQSTADLNWPISLETAGMVTISTKYAHSMLYAPYYPASQNMRENNYGIENGNKLTEYAFSTWVMPNENQLQLFNIDNSGLQGYMNKHISLPEEIRNWALPITQKLTNQTKSVFQKAQNIAGFVRNSASYDTNTPRMPVRNQNFAQWFLESSDTGYCVHFATATTVLLQAAGVPARYVTGYMVNAVAGQNVEVTGEQAHAWCEYWLPGFGWTVLESTPPDLRSEPTEETVESQTQSTQMTGETTPVNTPNQTPVFQEETQNWDVVFWLLGVVGFAGILWGQYAIRIDFGKKHLKRGSSNAQALAYWQRSTVLARHLKETPPEALRNLAEKAKFSQYMITAEELELFATYEAYGVSRLKKQNLLIQIYRRLILALY